MIKEFTYCGYLKYSYGDGLGDEWSTIKIGEYDLFKKIRAISELYETDVQISYYTAKSEQPKNKMMEGYLKKLFGAVEAEQRAEEYCYSEMTYGTDYEVDFTVGGHCLFQELKEHENKYIAMIIRIKYPKSATI